MVLGVQQENGKKSLLDGWNSPPNLVTYARIVLVLAFLWLDIMAGPWGQKDSRVRFAAAVLFIVAALTDKLDGWMARTFDQVTELGKLMDPIADKLLICSALVVASVFGEVQWWVTALFLIREMAVTAMRFLVIDSGGKVIAADKAGKYKTLTQCIGLGMLIMPVWALSPQIKDPARVAFHGGGPAFSRLGVGVPTWWFCYYGVTSLIIKIALILCLYSGYIYIRNVVRTWKTA